jgi:hypothetical protein
MFSLTKHERLVLVVLAVILLTGSLSHYAMKKVPYLWNLLNIVERDKTYFQKSVEDK